ncbi:MAG: ATP-binding protein [Potamolinea sp.]
MNSTPKPTTTTNTRRLPPEFQEIIASKSQNFVGREFVFAAITNFLGRHTHGYFTIVGAPGTGKSAILSKYVQTNPNLIYYNIQIEGKNRAEEFLKIICTQLINSYPQLETQGIVTLPDNFAQGSWFLSFLLQKISEKLEQNQRLIIAIDALDAIDRNSQILGSNLFYLPRYIPPKVYFILTRRPFLKEKSGLLIETPFQLLNLEDFAEENSKDLLLYIQEYLTPPTSGLRPASLSLKLRLPYKGRGESELDLSCQGKGESESDLSSENCGESYSPLLVGEGLGERSIQQLVAESENNFMYLSERLKAIAPGVDGETRQFEHLPPSLEAYYQSHWQKMSDRGLSVVELGVLRSLVSPGQGGRSIEAIAEIIDEDEYEVEEVLSNWIEFLQQQQIGDEIYYSFYHSSFCDWLGRKIS